MKDIVNTGILKLEDSGKLKQLKEKWWLTANTNQCQDHRNMSKLSLENIGGAFLLLTVGLVCVMLMVCLESRRRVIPQRKERVKLLIEEVLAMNIV